MQSEEVFKPKSSLDILVGCWVSCELVILDCLQVITALFILYLLTSELVSLHL